MKAKMGELVRPDSFRRLQFPSYTLKSMREISHSLLQAYRKMSISRVVKTAVVYLTEVTMVSNI